METRTIIEEKLYKLILNPMRSNTEAGHIVALSYDKQKLIDYHNSLLAPQVIKEEGSPSFDSHGDSHVWNKAFQIGSALEWFNPCYGNFEPDYFGHGVGFEWIE